MIKNGTEYFIKIIAHDEHITRHKHFKQSCLKKSKTFLTLKLGNWNDVRQYYQIIATIFWSIIHCKRICIQVNNILALIKIVR